jgi:hypothetical protein
VIQDVETAHRLVDDFIGWLDVFGERSYDPYDFWGSPLGRRAKRLFYRRRVLGSLAAMPFVAFDLLIPSSRRLISSPQRFPIADAHYAMGFFHWAEASGDDSAVGRGEHFLAELERSRCPGFKEFCWGYPFYWESRAGTIRPETPLITTTPYVYEAFEAGYQATAKSEYLGVMDSIAKFAAERIPATDAEEGCSAAAYTPFHRTMVVNASSYRGFLLAAAGRRFERPEYLEAANRNISFVLACQRGDGSWPYDATEEGAFVDNFHTCMVLKNLYKFSRIVDRPEVLESLHRGYAYYSHHLLDHELQPVPFAVRPRITLHRGDLYDYAEGINLAVLLRDVEPDAHEILHRLLTKLASHGVLRGGHFVTRQLVLGRNTISYHRWAQSQVFHALAHCCRARGS